MYYFIIVYMNMQFDAVVEDELFRACKVLFGPGLDICRDFLFYVQKSGVKSAYRKRAMQTHPDTAAFNSDGSQVDTAELFIETNWAYEKLLGFIKRRDDGHGPGISFSGERGTPHARVFKRRRNGHNQQPPKDHFRHWSAGSFYRGTVPKRRLMLGQYLFYSGAISWEALIKAIVWQRHQRPRIGDIARDLGLVGDAEMEGIASGRVLGEQTGEAMVRHGALDDRQLAALISAQRRMQRPFGEYFVSNRLLSREQLDRHMKGFFKHNVLHDRPKARWR